MRRGSIVWVNLEDVSPPEMGKTRPALIISNTEQNTILNTVAVLPMSSRPPEIWPLRLKLQFQKGKDSFVIIPGIRQVHKLRLLQPIGEIPQNDMKIVEEALFAYLSD